MDLWIDAVLATGLVAALVQLYRARAENQKTRTEADLLPKDSAMDHAKTATALSLSLAEEWRTSYVEVKEELAEVRGRLIALEAAIEAERARHRAETSHLRKENQALRERLRGFTDALGEAL